MPNDLVGYKNIRVRGFIHVSFAATEVFLPIMASPTPVYLPAGVRLSRPPYRVGHPGLPWTTADKNDELTRSISIANIRIRNNKVPK